MIFFFNAKSSKNWRDKTFIYTLLHGGKDESEGEEEGKEKGEEGEICKVIYGFKF